MACLVTNLAVDWRYGDIFIASIMESQFSATGTVFLFILKGNVFPFILAYTEPTSDVKWAISAL